jgi:DNA (cytosine-5)-methyltransferase 1
MLVVENVAGLLTSNGGADFARVVSLMAARGYLVSALVLNASDFVPQSRPRLFIIGAAKEHAGVMTRIAPQPDAAAPSSLLEAVALLPAKARRQWRWIAARPRPTRNIALINILDEEAPFDSAVATKARLAAMAPRQRRTVDVLAANSERRVGAAFRRIRIEDGVKRARIEARFDGIAGCVRTSAGGSSRQIIFDIDRGKVRTRLMTPREAARAMGLSDEYLLPERATAALTLVGDGVCPPVVSWLAETVLEALISPAQKAA